MEKIKSLVNAELRSPKIAEALAQSMDNPDRVAPKTSLKQNYIVTIDQLKADKTIYLESVVFLSELAW